AEFFPLAARAAFASAPPEEQEIVFFRWWTRIEAAVKVSGRGLDLALSCFNDVTCQSFEAVPGLAVAVAAEGEGPLIVDWQDDRSRDRKWSEKPGQAGSQPIRQRRQPKDEKGRCEHAHEQISRRISGCTRYGFARGKGPFRDRETRQSEHEADDQVRLDLIEDERYSRKRQPAESDAHRPRHATATPRISHGMGRNGDQTGQRRLSSPGRKPVSLLDGVEAKRWAG